MRYYASFTIGGKRVSMEVEDNFADCVKRCSRYYRDFVDNPEMADYTLGQNILTIESSYYVASAMKLMEIVNMYGQDLHRVIFFIEHAENFDGFYDEGTVKDFDHVVI
jgi:hypothetical protein